MSHADDLAALEPRCTLTDALALFDALPAVTTRDVHGRWRGRELATGHPWDGVLRAAGWWGKDLHGDEGVHPLLMAGRRGPFPLEPRLVPLQLVGRTPLVAVHAARRVLRVAEPLVRARTPGARLREITVRGVTSAAMVYDHLPVVDSFRRVDDRTLLGLMDARPAPRPFLFVLTRP